MFCPKCGQQSSDEVRFCPRCGLPLTGLAAYVAGNEFAPPARPDAPQSAELTAQRLGTRRGAKLMFFSVVLFPIFFGLCFLVDGPGPLFVPFTVFLAGLVMLVYARLFGDELIQVSQRTSRRDLGAGAERPALGAVQPRAALQPAARQHRRDIPAAERDREHDEAARQRLLRLPASRAAACYYLPSRRAWRRSVKTRNQTRPPMLNGKSVICFGGEDWWYHHPHSKNHLMRRFARAGNRVVFNNLQSQASRAKYGRITRT